MEPKPTVSFFNLAGLHFWVRTFAQLGAVSFRGVRRFSRIIALPDGHALTGAVVWLVLDDWAEASTSPSIRRQFSNRPTRLGECLGTEERLSWSEAL